MRSQQFTQKVPRSPCANPLPNEGLVMNGITEARASSRVDRVPNSTSPQPREMCSEAIVKSVSECAHPPDLAVKEFCPAIQTFCQELIDVQSQ